MRGKFAVNVLNAFLISALVAAAGSGTTGSARALGHACNAEIGFQEDSFSLTRLPENPDQYSLVISNTDERSISGLFSVAQLQILRAIMVEAEEFAISAEGVGTKEPITTRFMDKQEPAFVVDVQKQGNESRLFLTLKTEIGRMTWEAGKILRSTMRENGIFFALLTRLEADLPKLTNKPSK